MTDKIDPRLGVLTEFLDLQYDEGYNGQEGVLDADVLAAIDAADRAAGIVRVDTSDEALVERLARRAFESWYQGEFGESPAAHVSTGYGFERDTRAFLAALREAAQ